MYFFFFFFSSRRRHTSLVSAWSSDVCSSDLAALRGVVVPAGDRLLQRLGRHVDPLREGGEVGGLDHPLRGGPALPGPKAGQAVALQVVVVEDQPRGVV